MYFSPLLVCLTIILCLNLLPNNAYSKDRIYLLSGQSNMMGRGKTYKLPPTFKKTPSNVTFYYQGRQRDLAKYSYFGPEVTFAHYVARAFPQDHHILIKYVATGSSITQWQPNQALYKAMIRQVKFSLKTPKDKPLPPIEAVVWMQGEADARSTHKAQQYGGLLNRFVNTLRHDLHAPNSLFIFAAISPEGRAFPAVKLVRQQQRNVQRQLPNSLLVETKDLDTIFDFIHLSAHGQMALGKRFAEAYIKTAKQRAQHREQ